MTAKTRRLLVAFLLAATIAFAACGGSSGELVSAYTALSRSGRW